MIIGLLAAMAVTSVNPQTTNSRSRPADGPTPKLVNTCLITDNVNQLVKFYESVLSLKAQRSGKDYTEFHTGIGVLAIFSAGSAGEIHSWLGEGGAQPKRDS